MPHSDCRAASAPRLFRLARRALVTACLAAMLVGCQEYGWRRDYVRAEEQARDEGKDLFIFYKWYLDRDSNDMLFYELSDPEVKALFQDTVNLLLDKSFGPDYVQYMQKYGVSSYPTSVIVRHDGRFDVLPGRVSEDEFLEWAKAAKAPPSKPPDKTGQP